MAEPRLTQRRFTWAPRTLAVISCALALLATQPALQAASPAKSRPIVLRDMGTIHVATTDTLTRQAPSKSRSLPLAKADESLFSSARRLHILATVEILQRLLISELRPAERQLIPILWFQPFCLGIAPLTSPAAPLLAAARHNQPPPIIERAFAIRHCLLAPPVS